MKFCGDWLPVDRCSHISMLAGTVCNLECTFTDDLVESGKAYTSILSMESINNIAGCGFSALSLANNHVYDAGDASFERMTAILARKFPHIQFFGTIKKPYAEFNEGGRRIAVIGCLEPCRSRGKGIFHQEDVIPLIHNIRDNFNCVYVYPHWGKEGEYTRYPSPYQRELARMWIDAGADGVFGSHSHVFQGHETYKGKPIYYSLGNFHFPHAENKLYEGTNIGLCVDVEVKGNIIETKVDFVQKGVAAQDDDMIYESRQKLAAASMPLVAWTTWQWAKSVGPLNLKKNAASWRIRLRNNFWRTLPKYLAWHFRPQTLLFRIASCCK